MPSTELEQLYDAHAQALFAFLLNFTRNEYDTQEILQDLFSRLSERPELLRGVQDPRGFLLRMAHHRAIDLIRRQETRRRATHSLAEESTELFARTPDPDEAAFQIELAAALGELPSDQRAVVHLRLWEELSFLQIAKILDLSPNTAASRYRYGLDKLRHHLRPLYDEIR